MGRVSHADLWGTYAKAEQQLRKPSGTVLHMSPAEARDSEELPAKAANRQTTAIAATPKSSPETSPAAGRKA